jgi:hypothetical protein
MRALPGRLDVPCVSALELLSNLRTTDPLWRGRRSDQWAFRGQADARWGLVPKAFRPDTNLAYQGEPLHPLLPLAQQRREELRALNHFLFLADRVGLPIPGDGQHLRLPSTVQGATPSWDEWPWPSVLETLAIAQHHGVPTRLLDFSHDALIAAFFAALGAWQKPPPGATHFAVWSVNLQVVSVCVEAHRDRGERPTVIWVTASRAANTFLHNQDALFLLDLDADQRRGGEQPPDLQDAIAEAPARAGIATPDEPLFLRFLVPHEEALPLLRLLWNEEYHPARIMPSYDHVVAALEYRRALGV